MYVCVPYHKNGNPPKVLIVNMGRFTGENDPEKHTRTATSTAGVVPVMNSPGSLYPASHAHKSVFLSYA